MASFEDLMPPIDDGPAPMQWSEYEARVEDELAELLRAGVGEKDMQGFLGQHPPLVPGAFPEFSGHGGWPGAMVVQPPLKGFGHRIPDFMWISRHSGAVEPVLVEIEDPNKPWLAGGRGEPRPSHQLTQALNQFRQWEEWLNENLEVFFKAFAIPPEWRRRGFSPRYLLIYGRKGENPEEITKLRRHLRSHQNLSTLTYDHLKPIRNHDDYLSLRSDGAGRYEALAMPATARLTPDSPEQWKLISGRMPTVEANIWISSERKEFLRDFLPRCDAWAASYDEVHAEVLREAGKAL